MKKVFLNVANVVSILLFCSQSVVAGERVCSDPDAVILSNRGAITDTACVVPNNRVLTEGGYQYQNVIDSSTLSSYPIAQIALGIPNNIEVFFDLPNYNVLHRPHLSGAVAADFGAKVEVFSTKTFALSGQGILIPSGGSKNFGSDGTGAILNAIGLYKVSSKTIFSTMLGASSLNTPFIAGGERFNSFNYSAVVLHEPVDRINLFAEIFGQTKTSPITGNGLNCNLGFYYEVTQNIVLDLEYINRINGVIGGYKNYVGTGATVYFS